MGQHYHNAAAGQLQIPVPPAASPSQKQKDKKNKPESRIKPCTVNKAHKKLQQWGLKYHELTELGRKMFVHERVQGMPDDPPEQCPVGWLKPPIDRDIFLNINYPKLVFFTIFQN